MIHTNKNKYLNRKSEQTGFGLLGLFGGAFLVMFFAVMAIALVPPYMENFSVRSCISSLAKDNSILAKNTESIKAALLKKLSVSNVSHISEKDISIEKNNQIVKIKVDYNVHAKFIKNVDFLVHFSEHQEVKL